jgi:DNA modification methylase
MKTEERAMKSNGNHRNGFGGRERVTLGDIKPQTEVAMLRREKYAGLDATFPIERVAPVVGMAPTFIRKICERKARLTVEDVFLLLDQDAYRETIVPRSMVVDYLLNEPEEKKGERVLRAGAEYALLHGHVLDTLATMPKGSVQCVVTSTPYWGLRIYKESYFSKWADGEYCPYGHEQTPEGFLRHTTEVLAALYAVLAEEGSIWWNVMDSFNTRTQIRSNAVEALQAMQGKDGRSWGDHECRRYSAGHSYLKDGEQCIIPALIAERASRIGYYVKTVITWAKTSTLPEPQESRVSRNLEYVLHLTKVRTPFFKKERYRSLTAEVGGRNNGWETDKLSDVWTLPTSSGRDGHGAQFPIALPGRCIALSTDEGDVVLDPFVGAGNAGVAARMLGRRFIGIDVCKEYLETAEKRIGDSDPPETLFTQRAEALSVGNLL